MSDQFTRRFAAANGGAKDLYDVKRHVEQRRQHAAPGTVAWFMGTLDGKYTSYGCYPKFWLASDGETLSYEACREQCGQIARAIRDNDNSGWRVVGCDVNWEDPEMLCAHTDKRIESAYAEDKAERVYTTHYVHKISNPNGPEPGDNVTLANGAFSNSKTLGKALRKAGVLISGARVREYRTEGEKVLVFPTCPGMTTYHHCIILTAV